MRVVPWRIGVHAALLVLLATLGCRPSTKYPLGKLSVRVIDARNNDPVRLTAVDLYRLTPSGKVYWRASSTDSVGIAVLGAKDGGVIEGDYVINVSDRTWHKLAPGETNDRPVTIKAGDDTVVTFRVVPRLPMKIPASAKISP
jgi:5-hydroxyisourate hydrolase-like protein (transthyretin family)